MSGLGNVSSNVNVPMSLPLAPDNHSSQGAEGGHNVAQARSEPPRETSSTSSTNARKAYYQHQYAKKFDESGVHKRAHSRLLSVCPGLGEFNADVPLGALLSRDTSGPMLKATDAKEADIYVTFVPEKGDLGASRPTTVDKQGKDHNGIPEKLNQGDVRDVHASICTHTAGNPLAAKQWTQLEETWGKLEEVKLLDASRAFESVKDPLMPSNPDTLSEKGKLVLAKVDELQKALVDLGEIENAQVQLGELQNALSTPDDPSTAWTKFDELVVILSDAKGDVHQTVLKRMEHLVNDPDLSSSRTPEAYDPPLAFSKLQAAGPLFDELKGGLLEQAKSGALDAAMNKFSLLGSTLTEQSAEAPDDQAVTKAKENFDGLEKAFSSSTFSSQKEAMPTFARLKSELWAFGDPLVVEARNGGPNRIPTARIQPTTFNPVEHGNIKVFRPCTKSALDQVLAASLVAKVWAAGRNVQYSTGELSSSIRENNPAKEATMSATIEYTDEAKGEAVQYAKGAFKKEPPFAKNPGNVIPRERNGVSCSTAIAKFLQAGALQDMHQKGGADGADLKTLADQATGMAALNPKYVSPRTLEHLLLTLEDEDGNPLFEYVGKMENQASDVRFTETFPPNEPTYLAPLSPDDPRSVEFQTALKQEALKRSQAAGSGEGTGPDGSKKT